MKTLTIKETVRLHKILWNYLSETGEEWKSEAFKNCPELKNLEPTEDCFACQQAEQNDKDCDECILDWGLSHNLFKSCGDTGTLWTKWAWAKTDKTRKRLAALIRDIPVKTRYQRYLK